jgi:hypothetical protein
MVKRSPAPSDRLFTIDEVTEAIAIVSILSGAAVAIIVPFIGARLERTRMAAQSREARTAEFRGLLDSAAQHLYEAWTLLYEAQQEAGRPLPRPDWANERLREISRRLADSVDQLNQDSIRIGLRTSAASPLAAAHHPAAGLVGGYEYDLRRFVESEEFERATPPIPRDGELLQTLNAFTEAVRAFAGVIDEATPPSSYPRETRESARAS